MTADEQAEVRRLLSQYHNLGAVGCGDCAMAERANQYVDGVLDTTADKVNLAGLVHYAIELNAHKGTMGMSTPEDVMNEFPIEFSAAVFEGHMEKLGVEVGDYDSFLADFMQCIGCPKPVTISGYSGERRD